MIRYFKNRFQYAEVLECDFRRNIQHCNIFNLDGKRLNSVVITSNQLKRIFARELAANEAAMFLLVRE